VLEVLVENWIAALPAPERAVVHVEVAGHDLKGQAVSAPDGAELLAQSLG